MVNAPAGVVGDSRRGQVVDPCDQDISGAVVEGEVLDDLPPADLRQ